MMRQHSLGCSSVINKSILRGLSLLQKLASSLDNSEIPNYLICGV